MRVRRTAGAKSIWFKTIPTSAPHRLAKESLVGPRRSQRLVFSFSFLAFLSLAGCKPGSPPSQSDASAVASVEPKRAVPLADPDPIVDLLHTVDSTVAVSSKVDNPHDYPEHLVDGRPDTAWNGKTGDLTGWIAFRVPKSVKVVRIEMTPGFDKVGPKGDLFTMNHRIKKVRISRQGQLVKEATLNVEKRSLQAIDIDAPGGDFKIDILETLPGSQKSWRELTVSELRVWGRPGGAPENRAHIPKMAIGSLDGQPRPVRASKTDPPRGPFASITELCGAYDKVMTPLIDAKFTDDNYPGKIPAPHCASKANPKGFSNAAFKHPPFKDALFVELDDLDEHSSTLLLQTEKGWSRTDVRAFSRSLGDPGCLRESSELFKGVTFAKTSTGQDVALISIINREVSLMPMQDQLNGAETFADTKESIYACRVDTAGAVVCEGPKTVATAHETLPSGATDHSAFNEIDAAKIPWTSRKKATVGPAGDLRLE
jgi:hypothetical protein